MPLGTTNRSVSDQSRSLCLTVFASDSSGLRRRSHAKLPAQSDVPDSAVKYFAGSLRNRAY
jgi:hypothetical protein